VSQELALFRGPGSRSCPAIRARVFGENSPEGRAALRIAWHAPVRGPRGIGGSAGASLQEVVARNVIENKWTKTTLGARNDSPVGFPPGIGPRHAEGLLSDGNFGAERWDVNGQRQIPLWVNA
jgi:hypothetical protein